MSPLESIMVNPPKEQRLLKGSLFPCIGAKANISEDIEKSFLGKVPADLSI
ncbi:MAG: hypothetical protein CM15mP45_21230 [Deltaproteobacteria bacterium]|nr:MAG: hypothetical protein CM15mP45_21230 [Deltaproteobacteria bacterium]